MADKVQGRVETDPLFLGLTRPAMLLGVTYTWGMLEFMLQALLIINTKSIQSLLFVAVAHGVGYMICSREPRFVELLMLAGRMYGKSKNRFFHGNTASYDAY